jgi:cytoskeletal protein CcmA (bactofilin family)
MAWFDRNPGGKKSVEADPVKIAAAPKPKVEPEPPPAATASQSKPMPKVEAAPEPTIAGLIGYLYKGSRVVGQLVFQGPARIDGFVEGDIQCSGMLTIGEGAEIRAKISGQTVVIRGKVEGNITAKEKVELLAPGRLIGNVTAPRLVIAEGVMFDGDCFMGVAKQKSGNAGSLNVNVDRAAAGPSVKLQADSKN